MKMKKTLALVLVSSLALFALAGCGGDKEEATSSVAGNTSSEDKTIVIGASPAPHAEILKEMAAEFEKEGYTLEVKEFSDYVTPNKALASEEIDANFFQHKPFLDDFNQENNTDIIPVAYVHYEPMALFPGKTKKVDDLKEEAKIAVPNDASNEARALLLLEENGLITLKEGSGIKATVRDIVDNPKNIDIVEMEAAQIPRALEDVDMAVINGNFAIASGIEFDSNVAAEAKDSLPARVYANLVAMRAADKDSEKAQVIQKVMTSEACKKFITEHYKGTVLPVDEEQVLSYFDSANGDDADKADREDSSEVASSETE